MRIHLTRGTVIALAIAGSAGLALAQAPSNPTPPQAGQPAPTQTMTGPAPGQAGDDPSMAKPKGSDNPAVYKTQQPPFNPESTVGLAPTDQPINNANPNIAGMKVPSAKDDTAAHNPSVWEHDKLPIITHTFNFTKEQKQAIAGALAAAKAANTQPGFEVKKSSVLPSSIELTPVPDSIGQQMPWVKPYKYVKLGNKIMLVDPNYAVVVSIIE